MTAEGDTLFDLNPFIFILVIEIIELIFAFKN